MCRSCLNCYSSQNVLNKQNQRCEQQEIPSIRISHDSHLWWKKQFHKSPLYFKIDADFEADKEIHFSSIGNGTTNIHKQNPVCNGYYIVPELDDVLKSGYC